MIEPNDYRREILGALPRKDTSYRFALRAWCRYHVDTEEYDRSVCVHRNARGDAVPVWREERRLSSAFARQARVRLLADLACVPAHSASSAGVDVLDMSHEDRRTLLEAKP